MSRFTLDHPTRAGVRCEFGHDAGLGFFAEVFKDGRSKPTAVVDVFTLGRAVTLQEVLDFMVEHCFFSTDQLHEALAWIATDEDESWRPNGDVMRVVEVVARLRGV